MRTTVFSSVVAAALLAAPAVAGSVRASTVVSMQLAKVMARQGGGFIPSTTTKDACDADEQECGRDQVARPTCYNASIGQSCCPDGHACPEDSFCLFAPYCCPNGLTPEECAAQNGVTLPPGFNTDAGGAAPTATAAPTAANETVAYTTSTIHPTDAPSNYTATSTYAAAEPSQFTGAASPNSLADIRGVAAVVLGAMGMLGLAL